MADYAKPTRLGILVLPSFNAMATIALIDPFRAANYLSGRALFDWTVIAPDAGSVTASNGLALGGVVPLEEASRDFDMVFVSASWTPEAHREPRILGWLRQCARQGTAVGGIDTGAFLLAYAGLLNGRRATAHYEHLASFRELFPDIDVVEDIYTLDADRMTCCGGVASGDLALAVVGDLHGLDVANAAARYIFHERLRGASEPQVPPHFEPVGYRVPATVRRAIVAMENNIEQPLSAPEIAAHSGLSQRQLERLFRRHTGVTPAQHYLEVRLDRARGMVTQTDMPMIAVAVACGFSSQEHFSSAYKARFAERPSVDRKLGRVPFQFRSHPAHARGDRSR